MRYGYVVAAVAALLRPAFGQARLLADHHQHLFSPSMAAQRIAANLAPYLR